MTRALALVLATVAAVGCTSRRTIGQPTLHVVQQDISLVARVDILFMIDNSSSETGQTEFRQNFFELAKRIDELAAQGVTASYHIGVIDSDMGAGGNVQACPRNDGGKLHTVPNPNSGVPPPANCTNLTLSDPFIDWDTGTGTNNIGGGFDVNEAFGCISAVGDQGCGLEAQLEAIHQALTPGVNPGFLRDDALLVILMITDEDDCSAPPDTDLFDNSAAGVAKWGVLQSFRCTQWGIACNGMPLDGNALAPTSGCVPITGGPLYDVSRYISLFSPGGVKQTADDLILAAIAGPPSPFSVSVQMPCQQQSGVASCPFLNHSCVNAMNGTFNADPGVRIAAVTSAIPGAINSSVCNTDYSDVMDAVADKMTSRIRGGCLPGAIVDLNEPGCTVTVGGVDTPRCQSDGRLPCWDLLEDMGCPARASITGETQTLRFVAEGASAKSVTAVCPLYEP